MSTQTAATETTKTAKTIPEHGDYRRYRGSKTFPRCAEGEGGRPCAACRAANAERSRADGRDARYRAKLRAQRVPAQWADDTWHLVHPSPPGGHGTITAATASGCDCERCHEAATGRRRANRATARDRDAS